MGMLLVAACAASANALLLHHVGDMRGGVVLAHRDHALGHDALGADAMGSGVALCLAGRVDEEAGEPTELGIFLARQAADQVGLGDDAQNIAGRPTMTGTALMPRSESRRATARTGVSGGTVTTSGR